MKKNEALMLGWGQGGCQIADCNVTVSKRRFLSFYINTSLKDLNLLKKKNGNMYDNFFHIPNADGCGRDRDMSKHYTKLHHTNMVEDVLKGYEKQKIIYIYFSLDGGSGGGSAFLFAKALRVVLEKANITKKIIGVPVLPALSLRSKKGRENVIEAWNEIVKEPEVFDAIYMINNDSRDALDDYEEINQEIAELFNRSYDVCSGNDGGTIDTQDREKMYDFSFEDNKKDITNRLIVMYKLENLANAKIALEQAKSTSIFSGSNSTDCKNLLISLTPDCNFTVDDVVQEFSYDQNVIHGYNKYCNFVMAAGIPMEEALVDIGMIKTSLEDDEKSKKQKLADKQYNKVKLTIDTDDIESNINTSKKTSNLYPTESTLEDVLDNDDLFEDIFN